LKDVSIDQLAEAIRTLAAGGSFIQPTVTAGLMRELERIRGAGGEEVRVEPLTGRELEVLRLMAGGYSNREIGQALFVAERTVKNHVSSILAKLGARDRTHAVLKGLRERVL
jgi:DNA-binding NarL/FixJ family response regulator